MTPTFAAATSAGSSPGSRGARARIGSSAGCAHVACDRSTTSSTSPTTCSSSTRSHCTRLIGPSFPEGRFTCTPHVHLPSGKLGPIKRVQWLRVLEEDVVGDVDDVVDRSHATCAQPALDPIGALAHLDPGDDPADVAAAKGGVVDPDRQHVAAPRLRL